MEVEQREKLDEMAKQFLREVKYDEINCQDFTTHLISLVEVKKDMN